MFQQFRNIPRVATATVATLLSALLLTAMPAHAGVAEDVRDALDEVLRLDRYVDEKEKSLRGAIRLLRDADLADAVNGALGPVLDASDAAIEAALSPLGVDANVAEAAKLLRGARSGLSQARLRLQQMIESLGMISPPPHLARVRAWAGPALVYDGRWQADGGDEGRDRRIATQLRLIDEALAATERYRRNLDQAVADLPAAAQRANDATLALESVWAVGAGYEYLADVGAVAVEVALDARTMGPWAVVYHAVKNVAEKVVFPGPPKGDLPDAFYSNIDRINPQMDAAQVLTEFGNEVVGEVSANLVGDVTAQAVEVALGGQQISAAKGSLYAFVEGNLLDPDVVSRGRAVVRNWILPNRSYADSVTSLKGKLAGINVAGGIAHIAFEALGKAAVRGIAEENAEAIVTADPRFLAYLEARTEYEFISRSILMWAHRKNNIARRALIEAAEDLAAAIAEQDGDSRDRTLATAGLGVEGNQRLRLEFTFSDDVENVRFTAGGRTYDASLRDNAVTWGTDWTAEIDWLADSPPMPLSVFAVNHRRWVDERRVVYDGIDTNPATVAWPELAPYGNGPYFAVTRWEGLERGQADTTHTLDLAKTAEGFRTADWMTYPLLRSYYESTFGGAANMQYLVGTVAGIVEEQLALECAPSCSAEQIADLVAAEQVARAWRAQVVTTAGAAPVWQAVFKALPARDGASNVGIDLTVNQFENPGKAETFGGPGPDGRLERPLPPYDAASYRSLTIQGGEKRGIFRGRRGRYVVAVVITAPEGLPDAALRARAFEIAGAAATGRTAVDTPQAEEVNPAPAEGDDAPPPANAGPPAEGPEVGADVTPLAPAGEPVAPEMAALPPPDAGPAPVADAEPAPVQLVALQKFPTRAVLSMEDARAALPQSMWQFRVVSDSYQTGVRWRSDEGWGDGDEALERAALSASDAQNDMIEVMVGEYVWDAVPANASRSIRLERASYLLEYEANADVPAFWVGLWVAAYEVGGEVVGAAISGPIPYQADWTEVTPPPVTGFDVVRAAALCVGEWQVRDAEGCAQLAVNASRGNAVYSVTIALRRCRSCVYFSPVPEETLTGIAAAILGAIHPVPGTEPAAADAGVAALAEPPPAGPEPAPPRSPVAGDAGAANGPAPYLSRVQVSADTGTVYEAEWVTNPGGDRALEIAVSNPVPESSPLRFTLEFSAPVQRPWLVTPLGPVALETESPTRFGAVVRPDPRAWPAEFRLHFAATDAFGRGIDANPATVPTPLGEGPLPRGAVRTFAGIEAGLDRNHVLGNPAELVHVPLVVP